MPQVSWKYRTPLVFLWVVLLLTVVFSVGASGNVLNESSEAGGTTELDSCTAITQSGTYVLTRDLDVGTRNVCIEIRASDVTVDGAGHAIRGNRTESDRDAFAAAATNGTLAVDAPNRSSPFPFDSRWRHVGVAVTSPKSSRVSNVTVRNVAVSDLYFGVLYADAASGSVERVTATRNGNGIHVFASDRVSVTRSIASENANVGIELSSTHASNVTGNIADKNDVIGILIRQSSGALVSENVANINAWIGIEVRNSAYVLVRNNTVRLNPTGVFTWNVDRYTRLEDNDDGRVEVESTGDELGVEGGVVHDESIEIDQYDGLIDDELRAYVYRSIARTEELRGLEFEEQIEVELITRAEWLDLLTIVAASLEDRSDERQLPTDRTWPVLFMADEDPEDAGLAGARIPGFFDPSTSRLVIISDTPGEPAIPESLLIHELTHVLTHQHFDINRTEFDNGTFDESYAVKGVIEGDAVYTERRYEERCGDDWECIPTPERVRPRGEYNEGIFVATYVQYDRGPDYIESLYERGGPATVDLAYDQPPTATTEIIHPDREYERTPIEFRDRASGNWTVDGSNTLGEAAIYAMFWYQEWEHGLDILEKTVSNETRFGTHSFNYLDPVSEGWANDHLVHYRSGNDDGYVWTTEWATDEDATEFSEAYVRILEHHGGEHRGDGVWRIPDGEFAGAYRVIRNDTTVEIVKAPTVTDLEVIRPRSSEDERQNVSSRKTVSHK